ncbi:MAG: hypothetical protein QM715_13465 [Nibricoccus sp.]
MKAVALAAARMPGAIVRRDAGALPTSTGATGGGNIPQGVSYNFVGMLGFADGYVVFFDRKTGAAFAKRFSKRPELVTCVLARGIGISAAKGMGNSATITNRKQQ